MSDDLQHRHELDLERIKGVSFDLDDTLWPVVPVIVHAENSLKKWLKQHYPRLDATLSTEQQLDIRNEVRAANPDIAHDMTELRRRGIQAVLQQAGYEAEQASHDAMAIFLLARNKVTAFDDVPVALGRLSAHFPLVALSNGNADIAQTPLAEYFSAGVSAGGVGQSKPHPEMFHQAANAIDCAPHELLHIGDHPEEDVGGALAQGCQAILVNRFKKEHSLDDKILVATELSIICQWLRV